MKTHRDGVGTIKTPKVSKSPQTLRKSGSRCVSVTAGSPSSRTMRTRAVLCVALLSALCAAESNDSDMEVDLETRAVRDFYNPQAPNLTNEKRLLGALHEVLEKLQTKRINPWEKKFGQVPTCDMGEHCAVRKGARIGRMCDCPRGAFCNFFLLKCL